MNRDERSRVIDLADGAADRLKNEKYLYVPERLAQLLERVVRTLSVATYGSRKSERFFDHFRPGVDIEKVRAKNVETTRAALAEIAEAVDGMEGRDLGYADKVALKDLREALAILKEMAK